MSIGVFGTVRPADVSPADVEIFYHYVIDRAVTSEVNFLKLDSLDILTPIYHNSQTGGEANTEILGGLYNLKLDSSIFSELGIYNIYVRPRQTKTIITDCGVLASLPSVRGIIIDLSNISSDQLFTPQNLVGYRVEYMDDNNAKIPNFFKIITSSFYCEPVVTNLINTIEKTVRYRYSETPTNLLFLTLTPSAISSNKPNTIPYIGKPNQNIILTNTHFNPIMIEIEMVEHDASTLANALYGNQSKSISNGIYTIYDSNNNIYKQYNLFEIKDEYNETLYEVREKRENIDETLNFDNIVD
jgi:hypothetical protein